MALRRIIDRLYRGRTLHRHLPAEFGGGSLFVTTTGGGLRYVRHDLRKVDAALLGFVNEFIKPGSNTWDVGANMGLFTFTAANRAGPKGFVLAVEADVDVLSLLFQSRAAMNTQTNARVDILPAAVAGPGARLLTFHIAMNARACNSLSDQGMGFMGGIRETRRVPAFTLDELLDTFPAPSLLKIDVEGAEMQVLSGASRMLSEIRPVLYLEVTPLETTQKPIAEMLRKFGYRFFCGDEPKDQRKEYELPPFNCIALPPG